MRIKFGDDGENIYWADVNMARFGWWSAMDWRQRFDNDTRESLPLRGPIFWRPTRAWVLARTRRHVRRRLLMHARTNIRESLLA